MRILVVDDEIKNAELTALALRDAGHEAEFVNGAEPALERMAASPFDALVTDLRMPRMDGLELMREVRHRWPATLMVMMTAFGDHEVGRRAMRDGACAYVNKEGDFAGEIAAHIARAARERELERDNQRLAGTVDSLRKGLATVIGESQALRQALSLAHKVAATDSTVLLRGESGTGKDLFARAIHFSSRRAAGPWVKVNCGALPENLLESELFGHEKGAFTGAIRQKRGRFEDADEGTLFLDEIGELPVSLQVKLLQVIEEKTFTRVGGNQPITVDVRIIAATNRELDAMVQARQFREDLFFRLNVFPIRLPPLRERPGDVAGLVAHVMASRGASPEQVSGEALQALEQYGFPGNVRELEHTLERAMILAGSDPIGLEHLSFARPELMRGGAAGEGPARYSSEWVPVIPAEGLSLETLERELILQSLERAGGNKSRAARLLGLTRRTLYSRMEKHGLRTPGAPEGGEGEDAGDEDEPRAAGAGSEGKRSMNLLRGWLLDNLGIKLVALLLALLIYLNVYTDRPATLIVSFPIQIGELADSLALSGPVPSAVQAELRGTGKQLIRIRLTEPPVKISLAGVGTGRFERALTSADLPLPTDLDIQVERVVSPRTVELLIDRKRSRRLPVSARVEGVPAGGVVWTGSLEVEPSMVEVTGPEKAIMALDSVRLDAVRLSGKRDTVQVAVGADALPDWCVMEPEQVTVSVPLEPEATRRMTLHIEDPRGESGYVVVPEHVTLTVSGPRSQFTPDLMSAQRVHWTAAEPVSGLVGHRVALHRVGDLPDGVRARLDPDSVMLQRRR